MRRHWFYFIVHSVLIITVLTNAAYAYTSTIMPITHCNDIELTHCCDNTTTVTNTLTAHSHDDCNDNDCSSQHQPALLSNFSFQSFRSTEILTNELCHSPRYYHEPLLKPPMA